MNEDLLQQTYTTIDECNERLSKDIKDLDDKLKKAKWIKIIQEEKLLAYRNKNIKRILCDVKENLDNNPFVKELRYYKDSPVSIRNVVFGGYMLDMFSIVNEDSEYLKEALREHGIILELVEEDSLKKKGFFARIMKEELKEQYWKLSW